MSAYVQSARLEMRIEWDSKEIESLIQDTGCEVSKPGW